MLVNWKVNYLTTDDLDIQPPDKVVKGEKYWFFRYWPEHDISVDVVDYTRLPFLHYLERKFFKFYAWQALKVIPRIEAYDVIISHGAQSSVILSFIMSLTGRNHPLHITIDVGCFNGARNNMLELLPIKFATRSLGGIIYHARIQQKYYEKHLRFLSRKTQFIPFGVDTEFFSPLQTKEENYIVAYGYMKRDYKTLCEAWQRLQPCDMKLNIIGMDRPRRFGVNRLPHGVNVIKSISINRLKQAVSSAKFVVIPLPYFNYSYGQMSLLQSMSMGKAVVVTKTPGTVDYVNDGSDALFVDPYNIEDMLNKIKFLYEHPDRVKEIGREARKTTLQRFNERIMAEEIYKFVRRFAR
jgi:glycosyltransferase involved in cell wall biosynthesis